MKKILNTVLLTKKYGNKKCLNEVSVNIEKGDIYGLIGRNGAGKTTFMKACLKMIIPTSGKCFFFGSESDEERKKVGALIENPSLIKNATAFQNLQYFSILYGGSRHEINEILKYVGLDNCGKKKVKNFSLGMRQRLGIAVAMLGNPEFIVLDEPINGLDPAGIKEIRDLIISLNQQKNITFLISSHLLDELGKIATKYGIINDGVLIEEITRDDLNSKCEKKLVIEVDKTQKAVEILKSEISDQAISIDEGKIIINDNVEDAGKINRLLVMNDINVTMINRHMKSLEQYFMEKVGE